jgi:integrase
MIECGSGRWRLQVAVDPDLVTGERRRLSRTVRGTRSEAKEALQRMVVEAGAGLYGGGRVTVGDLLEQFIASATLEPSTREDWQSIINRHLKPALNTIPLWKLTARDCDQLYARMARDGLGPSRVRCAHVVLHRAVAQAVRWGWLARNQVSSATRPSVPKVAITPPGVDAVRAALEAARKVDRALWRWLQVAVATGARRGEVCALRWCDVDFGERIVRIERSVSATASAGVVVKSTKTGRSRVVSLTPQAVEALSERRSASVRGAEEAGRGFQESELIFSSDPCGRQPWRPEVVTRRWGRFRAAIGMGHVRIHDLRHFVVTELLTAGIDLRTVANRLGHARTSTTLDIYWAWVPARDRDAADHLGALLGSEPRT